MSKQFCCAMIGSHQPSESFYCIIENTEEVQSSASTQHMAGAEPMKAVVSAISVLLRSPDACTISGQDTYASLTGPQTCMTRNGVLYGAPFRVLHSMSKQYIAVLLAHAVRDLIACVFFHVERG
jgi:hypothetical protein